MSYPWRLIHEQLTLHILYSLRRSCPAGVICSARPHLVIPNVTENFRVEPLLLPPQTMCTIRSTDCKREWKSGEQGFWNQENVPGIVQHNPSLLLAHGRHTGCQAGRRVSTHKWQALFTVRSLLGLLLGWRALSRGGGPPLQAKAVPGGLEPQALQQRASSWELLGEPVAVHC